MEAFEQLKQMVNQPQPNPYFEKGYSLEVIEDKEVYLGVKLKKDGKVILSHEGFDLEESKKRIVEHLLITGIHALNGIAMNNEKLYSVVDRNGFEIPRHHSGRGRTSEEADSIIKSLDKHGEHGPYKKNELI